MANAFWFRVSAILTGCVLIAGIATAQTKIGVVSLQKALEGTAELKQAQLDLEAKYRPRQQQLAALEKEIAQMQQEAQANQAKYDQNTLAEVQTRIQRKTRDYERAGQALQDDVNRERADALQRMGMRMQEVIKKVAEEKGFDLVVDATNTMYFKTALDLSADVTVAYDKAYPAKK
jgi:outer membrane protein